MAKRKVTWTKQATLQLKTAIAYIRKDSIQNANSVLQQILDKVNALADDKVVHRKDPYKINKNGHYLYFEILKHRIVYYKLPTEVVNSRIRHTSREPKKY
jgi:toxin ParE1/3/4